MKPKDQVQLEEAYQSVHEAISSRRARESDAKHFNAGTNSYPKGNDQEDPVQLGDGRVTAKYKTAQPGMGKTHEAMSDEQKREVYDVMFDDRPNKLTTIYNLIAGGKWSLEMFKYFIKNVEH
jgi:hypothetical protein